MKKGYQEISLLLLLVYLGWKFQTAMARHSHLSDCRRCAPGFGVSRPCSRHRDTECVACPLDSYSAHSSARRPCIPCSRCGTGLYVAHACTPSRDTICDSCHTYRGPHNVDYYQRCVKPLNSNDASFSFTKERVEVLSGVPSSIVIFASIAVAVLSVVLVTTCCVVSNRQRCKRVDHRYEAVATQEAVML